MDRSTIGFIAAALIFSGCGEANKQPLATDGPNQVLFKVTGMS